MRPRIRRVGGRDRGVFFQLAEHEHRHLGILLHRGAGHGNRCVKEWDGGGGKNCAFFKSLHAKERQRMRNNLRVTVFVFRPAHFRATRAQGTQESGGSAEQDRQLPQRSSDIQWRWIESSQLLVKTLGKASRTAHTMYSRSAAYLLPKARRSSPSASNN